MGEQMIIREIKCVPFNMNIYILPSFLFLSCDAVTGTKVFVMPGGMMKSNGNLVDLIEKVKPEIRTLIEKCNTVSRNSKSQRYKTHTCCKRKHQAW